jgi:hypothetical protein
MAFEYRIFCKSASNYARLKPYGKRIIQLNHNLCSFLHNKITRRWVVVVIDSLESHGREKNVSASLSIGVVVSKAKNDKMQKIMIRIYGRQFARFLIPMNAQLESESSFIACQFNLLTWQRQVCILSLSSAYILAGRIQLASSICFCERARDPSCRRFALRPILSTLLI